MNPHMAWQYTNEGVGITVKGSYCINLWISLDDDLEYWKTPYTAGASEAPMFGCGSWKDSEPYPLDEPPLFDGAMWDGNTNELQRFCVNRHNGGVNLVYMDLSVRKVGLKSLWVQKWHRQWSLPPDPLPSAWDDPGHWMYNFKNPE